MTHLFEFIPVWIRWNPRSTTLEAHKGRSKPKDFNALLQLQKSLILRHHFFQVFRHKLTSSTCRLLVFKEILAEDLPDLQFPLLCSSSSPAVLSWAKLENKIKMKGHFGNPAVSLQVLLAVVEDFWGLSGEEKVRSEVSEGLLMPGQLPRECLSVCPSLWGWQEAVPSVTLQMRLKSSPWPWDSSSLANLFYPSINVKQRCFITIL